MKSSIFFSLIIFSLIITDCRAQNNSILLKNVTLIDGTGKEPEKNIDLLIRKGKFTEIGKNLHASDATQINMEGKTIMPSLICAHAHVGTLKGTTVNGENYTRENIFHQLDQYQSFGISAVLSMGTDQPMIFNGLRDSSVAGLLPGAKFFSAGYGFGSAGGAPGNSSNMDYLFRPTSAADVPKQIEELSKVKPTVIKIWVDGQSNKMSPEIYSAIIREAHKHGIRVAAHVYYLEDAHKLVDAGLDIFAHSIRDQEIDDALLKKMKDKGVAYMPTLTLDEFAFIYASEPSWINDAFFKASLEPGVYEMITSPAYQEKTKNDPGYTKKISDLKFALINLKKIFKTGILVALGTDSGALPIRPQGFAEHRELELMVQAGLTPLEAITVSTKNAAAVLKIQNQEGTIAKGMKANFIVLSDNPAIDIRNTKKIEAVYQNGILVSKGPL